MSSNVLYAGQVGANNHIDNIHHRKDKNKASMIARLSKLWTPINKSLVLSGVIAENGVVRGNDQMATTLGEQWAPTFAHKSIPEEEAKAFLDNVPLPRPSPLISVPSFFVFVQYLKRIAASSSAPGPDGLPYRAWYMAGHKAWVTLYRMLLSIAEGVLPPGSFNSSLLVFLPKGESESDAVEVLRLAKDTRPISLKNSDNKTITGSLVSSFSGFAKKNVHKSQNGFISGRFFLRNAVDLDSAARIFPCTLSTGVMTYVFTHTLFRF